MKSDSHLYLVSSQATPNITPALDTRTCPKEVILLVSQDMQTQAKWLETVLKQAAGVSVRHYPLEHPWDIQHIQDRILELLAEYENRPIALNATGGTKPMSIAAYEAFREFDKPIFYIHPEKDQLVWMYPREQEKLQLQNRIKLNHFLQAHGSRVLGQTNEGMDAGYKELVEDLIAHIDYFSEALGVLNYYANSAEKNGISKPCEQKYENFDAFMDLLDRLEQIGVLSFEAEQRRLRFRDENSRFFANGGWLEDYVLNMLNALKKEIPEIQDTAKSLAIEREKNVKNEIDVACLVDNKLHLIECKVKKFNRPDDNSGVEAIYKLDSITDIVGGVQARGLLVSYRELSKSDRERASSLKVKIIQKQGLKQLRSELARWLRQAIRD